LRGGQREPGLLPGGVHTRGGLAEIPHQSSTASGGGVSLPGISDIQQVVEQRPFFVLLMGADRYAAGRSWWPFAPRAVEYPDLERVVGDIRRLRAKIREIRPDLPDENIVEVVGREATADGLRNAQQVLIHKLAQTNGARVLVFWGGHGHENHMVACDCKFVPIDWFFGGILDHRQQRQWERAIRPQIIPFLDSCRGPVPPQAVGAAREPFRQGIQRPTLGSIYYIYGTASQRPAVDGKFTDVLLEALDEPGLNLEQLVNRMRELMQRDEPGQRIQYSTEGAEAGSIVLHPPLPGRWTPSSPVGSSDRADAP